MGRGFHSSAPSAYVPGSVRSGLPEPACPPDGTGATRKPRSWYRSDGSSQSGPPPGSTWREGPSCRPGPPGPRLLDHSYLHTTHRHFPPYLPPRTAPTRSRGNMPTAEVLPSPASLTVAYAILPLVAPWINIALRASRRRLPLPLRGQLPPAHLAKASASQYEPRPPVVRSGEGGITPIFGSCTCSFFNHRHPPQTKTLPFDSPCHP